MKKCKKHEWSEPELEVLDLPGDEPEFTFLYHCKKCDTCYHIKLYEIFDNKFEDVEIDDKKEIYKKKIENIGFITSIVGLILMFNNFLPQWTRLIGLILFLVGLKYAFLTR